MQDLMTPLMQALQPIALAVFTALGGFIIAFLNTKKTELQKQTDTEIGKKYVGMVSDTVIDCVKAVNQTFVDALKKDNAFTKEAQQEAFIQAYGNVLLLLSDDCKEYITETFGDLERYLTNKIEAAVKTLK